MMYLPIKRDIDKLPKQFVVNVCYKLIGENFNTWVRVRIDERNQKVEEKRKLMIAIDPEIANIFNNSNFVSCKCF